MLCCVVMCRVVLCCDVFCCVAMCCSVLCFIVLYFVVVSPGISVKGHSCSCEEEQELAARYSSLEIWLHNTQVGIVQGFHKQGLT